MIPIEHITGRLGNKMFQFAALYSFTKDQGLDYFVQDEKWFKKYENEIRAMFSVGIGFIPYVSIHVRRGDYLNKPQSDFHYNLSESDYYDKAIALFPGKQFIVCSDDIEWCKNKWKDDDRFTFSDNKDEIVDFNLLASCESHIIANSSFSWWSAWLCPNPNKKVVAPSVEHWYKDGVERTVCPSNWIRL